MVCTQGYQLFGMIVQVRVVFRKPVVGLQTRGKYHHLMTTLHLTPKMTAAQVVKTSVTNNSLSKDLPSPGPSRQTNKSLFIMIG